MTRQQYWFKHSSLFSQFRWNEDDSAGWMMMMKCNTLFYHFQLTISIIESYSSYLDIYPCLLQVTLYTFVFIQYWTDSYSYHNNDNNYVTYAHKKPTNGIKKQRRKFVIVWIARKSSTVWMALSTYQLRLFSFLSLFLTLLLLCFPCFHCLVIKAAC